MKYIKSFVLMSLLKLKYIYSKQNFFLMELSQFAMCLQGAKKINKTRALVLSILSLIDTKGCKYCQLSFKYLETL